jgi:hypothetical protein
MVDFWEMNNQTMEVDAEQLSSRQFNWFFNYMCYKESKLKALIIKTQNLSVPKMKDHQNKFCVFIINAFSLDSL